MELDSALFKYVSPPYRGGSVVRFGVTRIQAFEGRIFLVVRGERKPAESAGLEVKVDGEVKEAVIGKRRAVKARKTWVSFSELAL